MKKLLKTYPFFLVLLPVFILLHIEKEYHQLIVYRFAVREIVILFVAPLLIYGLLLLFTRSVPKSNAISFGILIVFYFLGELKDMIRVHWPANPFQSYSVLLPVTLILLLLLSWLVMKTRRHLGRLILFFNLAVLLFILTDLTGILVKKDVSSTGEKTIAAYTACSNCGKPDIYYIVFDAYASSEMLRQEFHFDNFPLESWLQGRGFRIIPHSRSNYNLTPFSISSIFNMDYLPGTDTSIDYYLKNYLPATRAVYNSALPGLLEKQGYAFVNLSIFNFNDHPSTVSLFDIWKISELYQQHNILKKVDNEIGWQFPSWLHIPLGPASADYTATRDTHDSSAIRQLLSTIARKHSRPAFVYTHIFIPHSPYSFDSAGHRIMPSFTLTVPQDKIAYVQQLQHANTIMKTIVAAIQQKHTPSVIIIQGDHGYRFFDRQKKEEEFHNFNAMYFPSQDYRLLNDSLTSVNTFRVVLNSLFKQKYPLLEDREFFLKYK